jgi:hypothetical protein
LYFRRKPSADGGRFRAQGEEVSGIKKSTDFGLTRAERKTVRASETGKAMLDHNNARKHSTIAENV